MTFLLVHKQNSLFLTKEYFNTRLRNSVGISVDVPQAAALLLLKLNKKLRLSELRTELVVKKAIKPQGF